MNHAFRALRANYRNEQGAAIPLVLGVTIAAFLLIVSALSFSLDGFRVASTDEDRAAALAAAYAGVDEYASRLANDSRYQRYGNPDAPFTIASGSQGSVNLPPSAEENPAFGIGTDGTWAVMAGTDGRAAFRYEVDNSRYSSAGVLRIRSTGKVGNETQSIVADLKQSGFIDFLYFTDYEIMDPTIFNADCEIYHGTPSHHSKCLEIQFGTSDVLDGPVHSNDIMRICSSEFLRKVTTASTVTSVQYVKPSGCGNATFRDPVNAGGVIPRVGRMEMPPTNSEMKAEARVDVDEVTRPGCMYTGPTQITFNSNGTVTVVSPWTKVTQPSLTPGIASKSPSECGSISALNSSAGATFTPPAQNLLYVQNVPLSDSDPNYWSTSSTPTNFTCNNSKKSSEGWEYRSPDSSGNPRVKYPATNEAIPSSSTTQAPAYGCRNGDAFVEGIVSGQYTVASDNFIYITGDVTYKNVAVDVLGLVGNNAIWVWNPMKSNGTALYTAKNRTIHAALLSVAHSFLVQNYDKGGDRGVLTVVGAIAQKFRGPVGTTAPHGYDKLYKYDDRLFSISPPKFLVPMSTTYGVTQYALVDRAFNADGSER